MANTTQVKYVDKAGASHVALVLHEYPNNGEAGSADPHAVNLAFVDRSTDIVGPFGYPLVIVQSVPHHDYVATLDPASRAALKAGSWSEV